MYAYHFQAAEFAAHAVTKSHTPLPSATPPPIDTKEVVIYTSYDSSCRSPLSIHISEKGGEGCRTESAQGPAVVEEDGIQCLEH
jgi:hypothetical protein